MLGLDFGTPAWKSPALQVELTHINVTAHTEVCIVVTCQCVRCRDAHVHRWSQLNQCVFPFSVFSVHSFHHCCHPSNIQREMTIKADSADIDHEWNDVITIKQSLPLTTCNAKGPHWDQPFNRKILMTLQTACGSANETEVLWRTELPALWLMKQLRTHLWASIDSVLWQDRRWINVPAKNARLMPSAQIGPAIGDGHESTGWHSHPRGESINALHWDELLEEWQKCRESFLSPWMWHLWTFCKKCTWVKWS